MNTEELSALEALQFNWTRALEDVWAPSHYHIEGLHTETAQLIRRGIGEARASTGPNPLGIAIQGQGGVGKTHMLGWTREQSQEAGGYFFMLGDLSRKTFWEEALGSIVEQLLPLRDGSRRQLEKLLTDLARGAGLEDAVRHAVTGQVPPSRDDVSAFITALRQMDPSVGLACQDTARALTLLASPQQDHQDTGYYFLSGGDVDIEERQRWGIRSRPKAPQLLISELSRLLALSGPTVVAVDQIDALIDEINKASDAATLEPQHTVAEVASGLMTLRDMTRRTVTVISCLPESWEYVKKYAVRTVKDRFRPARQLQNIPSADVGRLIIEKRFAVDFASAGFTPPYPTWPIRSVAFEAASRYTARKLLQLIEAHVSRCLHDRVVIELDRLGDEAEGEVSRQQAAVAVAGCRPA